MGWTWLVGLIIVVVVVRVYMCICAPVCVLLLLLCRPPWSGFNRSAPLSVVRPLVSPPAGRRCVCCPLCRRSHARPPRTFSWVPTSSKVCLSSLTLGLLFVGLGRRFGCVHSDDINTCASWCGIVVVASVVLSCRHNCTCACRPEALTPSSCVLASSSSCCHYHHHHHHKSKQRVSLWRPCCCTPPTTTRAGSTTTRMPSGPSA